MILAARTSHSVHYGELVIGILVAMGGSMLALNVRGCADMAADFLENRTFSTSYRNETFLRVPAGFFAILGYIIALTNLRIMFLGF